MKSSFDKRHDLLASLKERRDQKIGLKHARIKRHKHLVGATERIDALLDEYEFVQQPWRARNPIGFPGYEDKIEANQEKAGMDEAIVVARGKMGGMSVICFAMDPRFLMASMGSYVGEQVCHAFDLATREQLPVIGICASGGARMQEGIVSLMQMAKTSMAVRKHSDAGLLYVALLTNPTTGGVTASFASLADVTLAEPKALIGFAGPRVIKETIRTDLPEGFQTAEYLLDHGFVDAIVPQHQQKEILTRLLKLHEKGANVSLPLSRVSSSPYPPEAQTDDALTPYQRVQKARSPLRPRPVEFVYRLLTERIELHGDRCFGDDQGIVAGLGLFEGHPVTFIATAKGTTLEENLRTNFGMAQPEGYRKAIRLMKQAQKFRRPVLCIVDTPGAYPGIGAEERGQGEAIARSIQEMGALTVPVLTAITGEGGSGGALALATCNELVLFENSVYSILSPEGFSTILYKDASKVAESTNIMKLEATDLLRLGICEEIVPEGAWETQDDFMPAFSRMCDTLHRRLSAMMERGAADWRQERWDRFFTMHEKWENVTWD